jgi:hypothetical protein
MKVIEVKNPLSLWDSNRIDIAAKLLYIRYKEEKMGSNYGEEVYLNHLKVWNDFEEINPPKKGIVEFLESFDKIIRDIKENKFDSKKSPIILNTSNQVINGSHRLAAAIYFNKPVYIKYTENCLGQYNCNYEVFLSKSRLHGHYGNQYIDSMALEYIKRKGENIYAVTIFPSANGFDDRIIEEIEKFGDITYRKDFFMNKANSTRLIDILYQGEAWLLHGGMENKANLAFPDSGFVRVFFVETNDSSEMIKLKKVLRDFFRLGKHSLHINDTMDETLRIASHILNENTISFINNATSGELMENAKLLFTEFYDMIREKDIVTDDLMIVGSLVLSLYGVRDIKDIDYISKQEMSLGEKFQSHNDYIKDFGFYVDDLLYNPKNYFLYKGVKILSLGTAKLFKQKRWEDKDKSDLLALSNMFSHVDKLSEMETLSSILENISKKLDELPVLSNKSYEFDETCFVKNLNEIKSSINLLILRSSPKWWLRRFYYFFSKRIIK